MLLERGNKVLITHRRLFEKDEPRYFVGEVVGYDAGVIKARGYSFVRELVSGEVIRKNDPRTKLVSLASSGFLVYQLPDEINVDDVAFESREGNLILRSGRTLIMNMAEYPHRGHV